MKVRNFILGIILMIGGGLFAQSPVLLLEPEQQIVKKDSSVAVRVYAKDLSDTRMYSIEISYNKNVLEYRNTKESNFFNGYFTFFYPTHKSSEGKILVDEAILGDGAYSGSGYLFTINFKVINEGYSDLNFTRSMIMLENDSSFEAAASDSYVMTENAVSAVEEEDNSQKELSVTGYPNPFNNSIKIKYSLNSKQSSSLMIYNLLGESVFEITPLNEKGINGEIAWNGTDMNNNNLPSGIYFIRLISGKNSLTQKILMLK